MSVKKRVASLLLALGMLATTAPAFAADTAEAAGELAVQKGAAISKNVAAEDYSYIKLGASVKGQSVVAGNTINFALVEYDNGRGGQRYVCTLYKGNKALDTFVEAFEAEEGLYTSVLPLDTDGMSTGTYAIEFYTQYYANNKWNTASSTKSRENFTIVKKAVGLNGISLVDGNGQKVTGVTIEKQENASAFYDVQFNPQNTTVNREVTVISANNNIVEAEDLAGTVGIYPTGYGKTTVTVEVSGKKTAINVFVPNPNSSIVIDLFSDVNTGDWFLDYVQYAYDKGIMKGVGNYRFAPNEPLTRAQIAQILYAQAGSPAVSGEMKFTDVAQGSWYYNAVLWASQNGIVTGYANGMFRPNTNITREQLARMLYAHAGTPAVSGDLNNFADGAKVSNWAKDAVIWAKEKGIIKGKTVNGKLCIDPQGNATRAEAATMMKNYLG